MNFTILLDDLNNGYQQMNITVPIDKIVYNPNKKQSRQEIYQTNEDVLEQYFAQKAKEQNMIYLEPIFDLGGEQRE